MKILDNFINKIGSDKLLHYLVGAWLVALSQPYGPIMMGSIFILFLILSLYKEYKLDNSPDLIDVLYYIGGSVTSAVSYIISLIL